MKLLCFFIGFLYALTAKAQVNCDSLREVYIQQYADKISLIRWDTAPRLLSDRNLLTIYQQAGQPTGKAFVSFFVEENGLAGCLEVFGAADKRLQDAALTLVSKLKFAPARAGQTYVPAMMLLRLNFVTSQY